MCSAGARPFRAATPCMTSPPGRFSCDATDEGPSRPTTPRSNAAASPTLDEPEHATYWARKACGRLASVVAEQKVPVALSPPSLPAL
eukprot:1693121-Pyramimonas_sp.AAC.1